LPKIHLPFNQPNNNTMDDLTQVLQSPTALMLAAGLAVILFLFGKLIVDSLIDSTDLI
jgi:hypothetical protein